MSDPSTADHVKDVLDLQASTPNPVETSSQENPSINDLILEIPRGILYPYLLVEEYLKTSEGRVKLLQSMTMTVVQFLPMASSRGAERCLRLINDILHHCDGTEVFDRELLKNNIKVLSEHYSQTSSSE
jgi:hypothetical protein